MSTNIYHSSSAYRNNVTAHQPRPGGTCKASGNVIEGQWSLKVADFQPVGSAKARNRGGPRNSQHCAHCETMLSDAIDITLSAGRSDHLLSPPRRGPMVTTSSSAHAGAAWKGDAEVSPARAAFYPSRTPSSPNQRPGQQSVPPAAHKPAIVLGRTIASETPALSPAAPDCLPLNRHSQRSPTRTSFPSAPPPPAFRSPRQTMFHHASRWNSAMAFCASALTRTSLACASALRASDLTLQLIRSPPRPSMSSRYPTIFASSRNSNPAVRACSSSYDDGHPNQPQPPPSNTPRRQKTRRPAKQPPDPNQIQAAKAYPERQALNPGSSSPNPAATSTCRRLGSSAGPSPSLHKLLFCPLPSVNKRGICMTAPTIQIVNILLLPECWQANLQSDPVIGTAVLCEPFLDGPNSREPAASSSLPRPLHRTPSEGNVN